MDFFRNGGGRGTIKAYAGCMFSRKSTSLIADAETAGIARQSVVVLKPSSDTRSDGELATHSGITLNCLTAASSQDVLRLSEDADVVCIDEIQFFDDGIVAVVEQLAEMGKHVIFSGLDLDFRRQPFGPMPQLLALADTVTKKTAVCMQCHQPARFSQLIKGGKGQIQVGGADKYEARCGNCHTIPEA